MVYNKRVVLLACLPQMRRTFSKKSFARGTFCKTALMRRSSRHLSQMRGTFFLEVTNEWIPILKVTNEWIPNLKSHKRVDPNLECHKRVDPKLEVSQTSGLYSGKSQTSGSISGKSQTRSRTVTNYDICIFLEYTRDPRKGTGDIRVVLRAQ
jgi:hypothetical protein